MGKNLKLFKRITCILGITFLVLGMVPLPFVGQVDTVLADTADPGEVKIEGNCYPACQYNSEIAATDPGCVAPPPPACQYNPAILASDPACVAPSGVVENGCQNDNQCEEGQVCLNDVCQDDPGDDDGEGCQNDNQCNESQVCLNTRMPR